MRKVISDIPVPTSLSAPSESGSYVIPKGHFVMACPGVAQMDARLWKDAKSVSRLLDGALALVVSDLSVSSLPGFGLVEADPMNISNFQWEPSRWTDKDGFAGQAGAQYDSKTSDMVDYGFGGSSSVSLFFCLTVSTLQLMSANCLPFFSSDFSHQQGYSVTLPAVWRWPTPMHWRGASRFHPVLFAMCFLGLR